MIHSIDYKKSVLNYKNIGLHLMGKTLTHCVQLNEHYQAYCTGSKVYVTVSPLYFPYEIHEAFEFEFRI